MSVRGAACKAWRKAPAHPTPPTHTSPASQYRQPGLPAKGPRRLLLRLRRQPAAAAPTPGRRGARAARRRAQGPTGNLWHSWERLQGSNGGRGGRQQCRSEEAHYRQGNVGGPRGERLGFRLPQQRESPVQPASRGLAACSLHAVPSAVGSCCGRWPAGVATWGCKALPTTLTLFQERHAALLMLVKALVHVRVVPGTFGSRELGTANCRRVACCKREGRGHRSNRVHFGMTQQTHRSTYTARPSPSMVSSRLLSSAPHHCRAQQRTGLRSRATQRYWQCEAPWQGHCRRAAAAAEHKPTFLVLSPVSLSVTSQSTSSRSPGDRPSVAGRSGSTGSCPC